MLMTVMSQERTADVVNLTDSWQASQASGAASGQPAIEISGLGVDFGSHTILHNITLSVPAGTVYGLVGPSGSGKTTLMRTILGLVRPTTGVATVLGRAAGTPALRRLVGYMPQNAAIYPDLSAWENLTFFGAVYDVPSARITAVLDLVDLSTIANRAVVSFSGGERQRVSLAAALLPDPPLLILDEPTVGLDPRLRHRLWSQFKAWAAEGRTLLVSTHVMDEASHTDCIAFIRDGRLTAEGSPSELLQRTGTKDLEEAVLRLSRDDHGEGRV